MPRAPRLQFEGAFYHAYHRGNRRERIFRDEADYAQFEKFLLEAAAWSGVFLYSWKSMPNHFHLVVETPDANLAEFMQRLLTRYAGYFNRRYCLVGHVFQGRYGARVCDRDAYFMELIRYVQLNAYRVKGASLAALGEWKWSSHRFHIGQETPPAATAAAFARVLEWFGATVPEARKAYAQFLADGLDSASCEDFYKVKANRFIGDEAFVEKIKAIAGEGTRKQKRQLRPLRGVNDLLDVLRELGVDTRELADANRRAPTNRWRQAFVYVGRSFYRFPVVALARALARDHSAVSQILRRLRGQEIHTSEVAQLLTALGPKPAEADPKCFE